MIGKPFGRAGTGASAVPHGRRGDARVRLHLPARLILLTGTQHCILEDLSVTGAAIIPEDGLPAVGASAILQCEHIEAFGQIRWARYGRCGLMFEEKLPLAQVVSLRHYADNYEVNERERHKQRALAWVQGKSRIV
ncbi:MAG: PilZ domain-containing protein [Novosphingobium sp.]